MTHYQVEAVLEMLGRIADSLEKSAKCSQSMTDMYKENHEASMKAMATREIREKESMDRFKERHEWDRKAMQEQEEHNKKIREQVETAEAKRLANLQAQGNN